MPRRDSSIYIPPALLAIETVIHEAKNREYLAAALRAARDTLRDDVPEPPNAIHAFIGRFAETGPYREGVARALAVDPGNIESDLHNAYAIPALLVGISLAYLILTNDQAQR